MGLHSRAVVKMTYQYVEVPGGTHGTVITLGPDVIEFFGKYTKAR